MKSFFEARVLKVGALDSCVSAIHGTVEFVFIYIIGTEILIFLFCLGGLFFSLENEKREPKKTFFVFPYIVQSSSIYVKYPPILQTVADFAIEGHIQTFSGCPQYRTSRRKLVLAVSRGGCQYRGSFDPALM